MPYTEFTENAERKKPRTLFQRVLWNVTTETAEQIDDLWERAERAAERKRGESCGLSPPVLPQIKARLQRTAEEG